MHLLLAVLLVLAETPAPSNQHAIAFVSKDGSGLAGTLSWPSGSDAAAPAFVLIGPSEGFADIAAALNDAGMTVLRYDRRVAPVGRQDAVNDAMAAVTALQKDPHVDPTRIYLLGRGVDAEPAVGAALAGAPVRGVVLVAPLSVEAAKVNVPVLLLGAINGAHVSTAGDNHLVQELSPASDSTGAEIAAIIAWLAETE